MLRKLRTLLRHRTRPAPRLTLSDSDVRFDNGRGGTAVLSFADLAAVVIETNDSGPWGDDVIWHLLGRKEGAALSIPQSVPAFHELMTRLQALPDFDNEQVIAAMGSTALDAFLCWETDGQVRPDSAILGFARMRRRADPSSA